jgi:hypothetical protein
MQVLLSPQAFQILMYETMKEISVYYQELYNTENKEVLEQLSKKSTVQDLVSTLKDSKSSEVTEEQVKELMQNLQLEEDLKLLKNDFTVDIKELIKFFPTIDKYLSILNSFKENDTQMVESRI